MSQLAPKKILYLITKSNWGGAQRYVYDIATALPTDRFDAVVALGGDGTLAQNLKKAGIRTIMIPGLQRDISFRKELQSFGHIWRIIKEERPDVLHVNSSKAGGLGAFAGRLLGVPKIVYSAHGWAFNEDRSFVSRFVVGFFHWLTILFSHSTIAVSRAIKKQMKWPFTQRKIVVVQNGRPVIHFLDRALARQTCSDIMPGLQKYAQDIWIGTIAELHPVKRHDVTINALKKLTETKKNVRLVIMGDGELRSQLESQVTKLGLQDRVFFLGHVDEAARLLPALDIFVLASRSEALGYVVIEAAQAGLPIVATRVGGIPEIITDHWDGLLIEHGDSDALADALTVLLEDTKLRERLAKAAKVRSTHFSLERMVGDTTAIYNL